MQIKPGQFIYMQSYNTKRNIGYKFSMEQFENNKLKKSCFVIISNGMKLQKIGRYTTISFVR